MEQVESEAVVVVDQDNHRAQISIISKLHNVAGFEH
jgi:hypothetical protein